MNQDLIVRLIKVIEKSVKENGMDVSHPQIIMLAQAVEESVRAPFIVLEDPVFVHAFETAVQLKCLSDEVGQLSGLEKEQETKVRLRLSDARKHLELICYKEIKPVDPTEDLVTLNNMIIHAEAVGFEQTAEVLKRIAKNCQKRHLKEGA